jgi:hypothetical protein
VSISVSIAGRDNRRVTFQNMKLKQVGVIVQSPLRAYLGTVVMRSDDRVFSLCGSSWTLDAEIEVELLPPGTEIKLEITKENN